MKFFLITNDADTCVGMRMAGIDSALVHTRDEIEAALENVAEDKEIGMLLITKHIREMCPEKVSEMSAKSVPVVVEIPDSKDKDGSQSAASDYIKNMVGISI